MIRNILVVLFWVGGLCAKEPSALYLTWASDPTTSMTIYWHTEAKHSGPSKVWYREEQGFWTCQEAVATPIYKSDVIAHRLELTGLHPGSTYLFRIGDEPETYRFTTLQPSGPLYFAIGGDAFFSLSLLREMNMQVLSKDVDFVVLGGDIAYSNGVSSFLQQRDTYELKRWLAFFKEWKKMRTDDGRLIPLVVTPGNHDVRSDAKTPEEKGRRLFEFFSFPKGASYSVLDIGPISLFLLDTGHVYPIEGAQTTWLEKALSARQDVPYKLAVYHISAYPAYYSYSGKVPTKIRDLWVPLFESYGIRAAFEHHNHVFKRTFPLRAGNIDPQGVIYLGDGAFGVPTRSPRSAWYLAASKKSRCFWTLRLDTSGCLLEAYDSWGKRLDALTLPSSSG